MSARRAASGVLEPIPPPPCGVEGPAGGVSLPPFAICQPTLTNGHLSISQSMQAKALSGCAKFPAYFCQRLEGTIRRRLPERRTLARAGR